MMALPQVLLLPPLMLALLVFAAPIQDGETWRVDQLTRKGPQKTLLVERNDDDITATVSSGESEEVFAKMSIEDPKSGRVVLRPGGAGEPQNISFQTLIKDFDREALGTADELHIELQNGEKAGVFRSGDVVYLTAPGQGVTFVARKVN